MDDNIDIGLIMKAQATGLDAFRNAENAIMGVAKAMTALSVLGAGAIVAFATKSVDSFIASGEAAHKMAEQLGITSAQASAWQEAGKHFGVTGDQISSMFTRMEIQFGRMEDNFRRTHKLTGPLVQSFKDLGIKLADSHGHLRDLNSLMPDVLDSLSRMTDVTERNATAQKLFGGAWKDAIDMIDAGGGSIKNELALVQRLGASMSGPQVDAAHAFIQTQRDIGIAFDAITGKVGGALIPYLQMFSSWLLGPGITAISNFATFMLSHFADIVQWIGTNLPKAITIAKGMFDDLSKTPIINWLKNEVPTAVAAAQTAFKTAKFDFSAIFNTKSTIDFTSMGKNQGKAVETFVKQLVTSLGTVLGGMDWVDVGKGIGEHALGFVVGFLSGLGNDLPDLITHHFWETFIAVLSIIPIARLLRFAGPLIEALSKIPIVGGLIKALAEGIILLGKMLEKILGPIVKIFLKFGGDLLESVLKGITGKGSGEIGKGLWNILQDVFITVAAFAEKAYLFGLNVIQMMVKGLSDPFRALAGAGWDLIKGLAKNLADFAGRILGDLGNIGKNIVGGIWNGITKRWSQLINDIKNLASNLPGPIKSALGISSPSSVFAEEIGLPIAQGIAKGVLGGKAGIVRALTGVTSPGPVGSLAFGGIGGTIAGSGQTDISTQILDELIRHRDILLAIARKDLRPAVQAQVAAAWSSSRV